MIELYIISATSVIVAVLALALIKGGKDGE